MGSRNGRINGRIFPCFLQSTVIKLEVVDLKLESGLVGE